MSDDADGLRALTVRQPWAELIIRGEKTIENRTWRTHYRGPLLIHAAQRIDPPTPQTAGIGAATGQLPTGAIVGLAHLIEIHPGIGCTCSPWAQQVAWHWRLTNPTRVPHPMAAAGRQGLWRPPPDLVSAIRPQLTPRERQPMDHTPTGLNPAQVRQTCATCQHAWTQILEPGADYTCPGCGQMFNAFGERVTKALWEIDPADAGEVWEAP